MKNFLQLHTAYFLNSFCAKIFHTKNQYLFIDIVKKVLYYFHKIEGNWKIHMMEGYPDYDKTDKQRI